MKQNRNFSAYRRADYITPRSMSEAFGSSARNSLVDKLIRTADDNESLLEPLFWLVMVFAIGVILASL